MDVNDYEANLTAVPETAAFIYRKILRLDLECDRCTILKSDPEGWQPSEGPITRQLARFALDGAVHREDVERFVTFTRLDQLRQGAASGQNVRSMIYRRKVDGGYRWNLIEVIPDGHGQTRYITLCVKDVDDMFREGAEREGLVNRSMETLRNLEDRVYIISSLTSLFFSTYYINLKQDTFRTVTQLGRVGDVLGDEVNYTAALKIYASHFIHPEDRADYLSIMNVQNLRDNLRWWQPCVVFEYRKLSDEPQKGQNDWVWVRASAILSRTGEDDQPQTAVYVAQDISDGRRSRKITDI